MLFAQISVFEQGHFFQLLHRDLRDFVANVFQVRRGNLDGLSQGGIDQRCQIHLGRRQLLVDRLEQAHVLQQLTLIAQGLQRIAHALGSRFARIVQGFFSKSDGFLHIGFEQLGTGRAPVGRAHVLHQQMHGFAALFTGNHESITLLLGAVVAHAKVHQAPGQAQVSGVMGSLAGYRSLAGCKTAGNRHTILGAARVTRCVSARIPRLGQHSGQHVVFVHIELPKGQGLFHLLGAAIQVVLQGTRHGLVQSQRAGDGFNVFAQVHAVFLLLGLHVLLRQGNGFDAGTA